MPQCTQFNEIIQRNGRSETDANPSFCFIDHLATGWYAFLLPARHSSRNQRTQDVSHGTCHACCL